MSFSCNHTDKQTTDVVEKKTNKEKRPMFLIMGRREPGFTVQETWINDKDRVSPVKINKNNTAPIYTRIKVSFFLRVTECQMVFELHWHLTVVASRQRF